MTNLLAHRGPDDAGLFVGAGVGLGARRLSIIDLAGGHQPLSNEDGTVWIAYNGEVFNAPALRDELIAVGHQFRTQTDTEVIVHGYEEWGTEVVARLRGMFAFAIWDGRRERLLLARDRFGMKPLYYAQTGDRFACASEIRPILQGLPQLPRRASQEALWHLFGLGFIPNPLTAFEGVVALPAAHWLLVENGRLTLQPYWQLHFPAEATSPFASFDEATEAFMAQLREAVAAWRLSDVAIGSLLSGGIDSSTLAALLAEISSNPIHTFTIAFDAASHDEAVLARATAQHIGSQHHEIRFAATDFDLLPTVVRHLEAPQCSATSIPIYMLYRACRDAGFKVILTGEGADELLGGYHWFDGDRRVRPLLRLPSWLRRQLVRLPLPGSREGKRVLAYGTADPIDRYWLWLRNASPKSRQRLLRLPAPHPEAVDLWRQRYETAVSPLPPLHQFLYLDAHTRLPDFINFEVDRMSMAASVEARPPFLDHHLWEFCAQLPPNFKLNEELNKRLVRKGVEKLLPTAVGQRPKKGLASPHSLWWRSERLPAWAETCLHPAALEETGYFDVLAVQRLRRLHQIGTRDNGRLLTGVLTTQLWHQEMGIGT